MYLTIINLTIQFSNIFSSQLLSIKVAAQEMDSYIDKQERSFLFGPDDIHANALKRRSPNFPIMLSKHGFICP